jgi:lipopolysaccharide/colanic/teichoic acid biosynthesis glycosyltransferase
MDMCLAKRLFDFTGSLCGLIVLFPVFVVIGALIKLEDGGPVFFRQRRVGLNGAEFMIWKFRSMVVNAEQMGKQLTVGRDSRVTRLGAWLRRLKLDEFPQLINVLVGEMSLVGPRPEVPKYVALYSLEQREVLKLKPGMTDLASIKYRNESDLLARASDAEQVYIHEIMPEKIRINLDYAQRSSVIEDLRVIFLTLQRVFLK